MFGDSLPRHRVNPLRRKLGERLQDELPFEHTGVGNAEMRKCNLLVAVEQDVDIDRSRPPALRLRGPDAAHIRLDRVTQFEKRFRQQCGTDFRHPVHVAPLRRPADRIGLPQAGRRDQLALRIRLATLQRALDVAAPLAQVSPQPEKNRDGGTRTVSGLRRPAASPKLPLGHPTRPSVCFCGSTR